MQYVQFVESNIINIFIDGIIFFAEPSKQQDAILIEAVSCKKTVSTSNRFLVLFLSVTAVED